MKLTTRCTAFATATVILATFALSVGFSECRAQTGDVLSADQVRSMYYHEQSVALEEYKKQSEQAMSKFRRLANKVSDPYVRISYFGSAQFAYDQGNLELAESFLTQELALNEDQYARLFYADVLIEEKKYLEALPSCLEISLEKHKDYSSLSGHVAVEYDSLTHLLLAYVLVQLGEYRASASAYNAARKFIEINEKCELAKMAPEMRDAVVYPLGYPLPSLSIDPDKADEKTLLEAIRPLFQFVRPSPLFPHRGIGHQFAMKMLDEAYDANPNSALIVFYKAQKVAGSGSSPKKRLLANRASQPLYQRAADLAGAKTKLGMWALRMLKGTKRSEIEAQKTIDYILENHGEID